MNTTFYRTFEDRHRGPREIVKARLESYLPFLAPWAKIQKNSRTLDLGCGRGEWLELLGENGFKAKGVDLDQGMLDDCKANNLHAVRKDALTAIKAAPDNSLSIVSGFHIAEHIPFEVLQEIVRESLRALKPSGLLILETPNPENLSVGTHTFYTDPTHNRPLPPELLQFAADFAGFERTKILRLNESSDIHGAKEISLDNIIRDVSPDCAIVAQKTGSKEHLDLFNDAFSRDYGISLEQLTHRYQDQLNHRFQEQLDQGTEKMTKALASIPDLVEVHSENKLLAHKLEESYETLSQTQEALAEKIEESDWLRNELEAQKRSFVESTSWKVTAPIRGLKSSFSTLFIMLFKVPLRFIAKPVMRFGYKHQGFRRLAVRILSHFPSIKARIALFMNNQGLSGATQSLGSAGASKLTGPLDEPESSEKKVKHPENMSETERFIHSEI